MPDARIVLRNLESQLEEICRQHKILKREIAEKMEVSNSYLSQILARGGTTDQIERIADALAKLGVTVEGETITAWYFDFYNALKLVDEAKSRDEGAIAAIKMWMQYRTASPKKKRELLGKLAA